MSSVRNNGLQKVGEVEGRKGDGGVQFVVGHAPRGCRRRGRREPACHFDRQGKIASGRKGFVRNEQGFANSRRCEEQNGRWRVQVLPPTEPRHVGHMAGWGRPALVDDEEVENL